MKKKFMVMILGIIGASLIAGCSWFGSSEEEEDVLTTIKVDASMLVDENTEVATMEKENLWKAADMTTIGTQNFIRVVPGKNLSDAGELPMTLYVNDANYIQALSDAKDDVYLDLSFEKINENDRIYGNINSYLRSLTFEDLANTVIAERNALAPYLPKEESPDPTIEEPSEQEEGEDDQAPVNPDGELAEEPSEQEEEVPPADMFNILDAYEGGKLDGENGVYLTDEEVQSFIDEYFALKNFSAAKGITLYDKDCSVLGNYTAHQLQSYKYALNGEPAPYEIVGGSIKASDLLVDTTYTTKAIDAKNGSFDIRFKNDTGKPELLFVIAKDEEWVIPLYNNIFSVTGYYPKGEWTNQGLITDYNFRILSFESDAELFAYMEENALKGGLRLSSIKPDEKGKYKFDSNYDAFLNDLDHDVQITSDTKHTEILNPGEAIGVLKDKQENFKMTIEMEEE